MRSFQFTFENITPVTDTLRNDLVWTNRFKETPLFHYRDTVDGSIREIDTTTIDPSRQGGAPEFTAFSNLLPSSNNNDIGDGLNTAGYRCQSNAPVDDRS